MRVAIFTGSALGRPAHADAAARFARELAASGAGIVYGGGRVGLRGVVADAGLSAGGEVIGVMPRHLVDQEIAHEGLTRLDVVADMHERKARIAELADAFVALPGGAGTLEELFEAWTWGQLGLHVKPVALLDVDGFYRHLIRQLEAMCDAGYVSRAHLRALGVVSTAAGFLDFAGRYQAPPRKWAPAAPGAVPAADPENNAVLTSVGWLCIREGHVLAVRSHGRDRFYLPGGKPENGESPEQALVREVREELGVDLTNVRTAFTVQASAHGAADGTVLTMHCFFGDHAGDPRPAREIAELAWLGPADVRASTAVQEVFARLGAVRPGDRLKRPSLARPESHRHDAV